MQVASTQKVPRHSLHTRHSGQAHSTPPVIPAGGIFWKILQLPRICGPFYGKCPTFFIYFVAYFLENGHVDTCPLCALLHILPTPEASPVKLSGVSGWYNAEVSSHYVYIMGSQSKVLYVGCTHDLVQRVYQSGRRIYKKVPCALTFVF